VVARRLESLVVEQGGAAGAADAFQALYSSYSKLAAHPRWPALRVEFDAAGLQLMTAPEWNPSACRQALGAALIQGRANLRCMQRFVANAPNVETWMNRTQLTVADATGWVRQQMAEIEQENPR
jgi:hypothetical protein